MRKRSLEEIKKREFLKMWEKGKTIPDIINGLIRK